MSTEIPNLQQNIRRYYVESESQYFNWGKDNELGIYDLHCGIQREDNLLGHYQQVRELARRLVDFSRIPEGGIILDAGCGAGAISFEVKKQRPSANVIGINIASNQLVTANEAVRRNQLKGLWFSEQDFNEVGFADRIFDRVIFCESFIHSPDKLKTLREMHRVLKVGGGLYMSDTFVQNDTNLFPDNKQLLDILCTGWFMPPISSIGNMREILKQAGFSNTEFIDLTPNILESNNLMRNNAQRRIDEGNIGTEIIQKARLATVACAELFNKRVTGYYFVGGVKLG